MSVIKPLPGDIGLYRIPGIGGFLIGLGQLLLNDGSRYTHAFIVVDDFRAIAAQPSGARYDYLEQCYPEAVYSTGKLPLTDEQRVQIVAEATKLLGPPPTPYSWLDYVAIGLHRFHIRLGFIERYVQDSGHMICSQLVDEVYKRAGVHLFSDGRLPQDVTPGDIANVLIEEW